MHKSVASALAVLALVSTPAAAHSWVEQLMVINPSGVFTGQPGYARNNTMRTAPGFSDLLMVHILPGQGQPSIEQRQTPGPNDVQNILPTDPMCKKTQQTQFQSNGSPRLKAAPGDMVALRYEENGHVTLPDNQKGKPANRGNVFLYGTTQPSPDDKLLDIFGKWNADGTGGNKKGKLLATQPFDDGQCYQVNSGSISATRVKQFPHPANNIMGTDLWCQNDIKIPTDAPSGKPYTLYWVWDWPTLPNVDPGLPKGKAEVYTTCIDVDITGTKATRDLEVRQAPASSGSNINNMAIPKYLKELAAAPAPAAPAAPAAQSSHPAAQPAAPIASSPPAAAPVASAPAGSPNAQAPPMTVTVTVTTGSPAAAPANTMATQPSLAVPAQAPSQPASAPVQPAAQPSSKVAGQSAAASMPPATLNIAAPALSPTSANTVPAASGNVMSAPLANSLPTFTGTATALTPTSMLTLASSAKNTAAPAVAPRSCGANKCKMQKRSRILGGAV